MDSTTSPQVTVREHFHEGFRFESRVQRAPAGADVPIVLVGGAFQRKESWGRLEEYLLQHATVATVDLPGWGAADNLPAEFGIDFLVAALRVAIDELGFHQVDVAAGSYGAMIGYRLAQLHPELVQHLFLMASMSTIPEAARPTVEHTLRLLDERRLEEFAEATVNLFMCDDPDKPIAHRKVISRILTGRFAQLTPDEIGKYVQSTRRLLGEDLLQDTPPMLTPTMAATGEHDTYTRPEVSRRIAATSRQGVFATVAEADHMLHLERAAESAELAIRFFSGKPLDDLPFCRTVEWVAGAGG